METTILELHNNEWLSDALRRGGYGEYIPQMSFLTKRLRGWCYLLRDSLKEKFHYNRA